MRAILVAMLSSALLPGMTVPAHGQVSVPLTTNDINKIDFGPFAGGTQLSIAATGSGDLVDNRWAVFPDGTLQFPASGAYSFANNGAAYPALFGGDGINHYVGGGGNYDFTGSPNPANFGFAGAQTTDTTDPTTIRFGAVVGTFAAVPTRADWFLIGSGAVVTVPAGGANLFIAVSDVFAADNHGSYSVSLSVVPEPTSLSLIALAASMGYGWRRTIRRTKETAGKLRAGCR